MYIRAVENAGTVTAYMSSADYKQLMEHARIGALVLKLPDEHKILRANGLWQVAGFIKGDSYPCGETLEQALLATGIAEE